MADLNSIQNAEGVDCSEALSLPQSAPLSHQHQNNAIRRLTVGQASQLSRSERLAFLMEFNDMAEPVVVGQIRARRTDSGTTFWLDNLQTPKGYLLAIPLIEPHHPPGVPLGRNQQLPDGTLAALRINVVPDNHYEIRVKGKPFAMQALGEPERLQPLSIIATDSNGTVLIPESVWDSEIEAITKPLVQERDRLQAEASREKAARQQELDDIHAQVEDQKAFFLKINDAIENADEERKQVVTDISNTRKDLFALKTRKEHMMSAYRQLSDFAQERAAILLDLDLISQD